MTAAETSLLTSPPAVLPEHIEELVNRIVYGWENRELKLSEGADGPVSWKVETEVYDIGNYYPAPDGPTWVETITVKIDADACPGHIFDFSKLFTAEWCGPNCSDLGGEDGLTWAWEKLA